MLRIALMVVLVCIAQIASPPQASAQEARDLTVSTVSRAPFSMLEGQSDIGFSIDLIREIADRLNYRADIRRVEEFSSMFSDVQSGTADLAIANISITSQREAAMDFSHPIFESGLQIMVPQQGTRYPVLLRAIVSAELFGWIALAFLMLLVLGMIMWVFERHRQPYFDRNRDEAWFPAFWWALHLVVNGGFEERVPRSAPGRVMAVIMVLSSLFVVSIFVATITATMTVEAISGRIDSLTDLYGNRVATIRESTAEQFLQDRHVQSIGFADLETMLTAFENDELDAIVFDAPVLAYYTQTRGKGRATMAGPIFNRENYGIAFATGSPLVEEVNQILLALKEDGTYYELQSRWFGADY